MQPEPVREYYVGGVAVPVGEQVGLRIVCLHEDVGRGPEWSTVTVNIGLYSTLENVLNVASQFANEQGWRRRGGGSPRGPVMACGIKQVVIGGFDQPSMPTPAEPIH